jgi:predicted DNA-binding transcriptional regulator AlpA
MMLDARLRPYTMANPPTSNGRIFLAHAFNLLCTIEFGFPPEQIETVLEGGQSDPTWIASDVLMSVRNLGQVFLSGRVETFARPIGGGLPVRLGREMWELDDFVDRFATCAIDPQHPFDRERPRTHWLFVDAPQFEELLGLLAQPVNSLRQRIEIAHEPPCKTPDQAAQKDRFLRRTEVERLVGLSRSTIYSRMKDGRFPANLDIGGVVVWREADVQHWMATRGVEAR